MTKTSRRWKFRAFTLALGLSACAGAQREKPHPVAPPSLASADRAARKALIFVEDDFEAARNRAKTEGKLLFVDGWAPWCHTCLSMQREVLTRAELRPMQDHYVFAALDTDRDENAEFTGRFPNWFLQLVERFNLMPTSLAKYSDAVALTGEQHFRPGGNTSAWLFPEPCSKPNPNHHERLVATR